MDRRDFVRLGAVAGALAVRGKPLAAEHGRERRRRPPRVPGVVSPSLRSRSRRRRLPIFRRGWPRGG